MGAKLRRGVMHRRSEAEVLDLMRADGLSPRGWDNAPGDGYARHEHAYHKVLYCVQGSVVFHVPDGDVAMVAGDRIEIEPGTPHAVTVGPEGVRCVEAPLDSPA